MARKFDPARSQLRGPGNTYVKGQATHDISRWVPEGYPIHSKVYARLRPALAWPSGRH